MSTFSLEDFDKHIQSLQSQVAFLTSAFDATDHNAPDWLATDLIALRNKSGRLQDDMQKFRDQLESEGLGVKKTSNKRLSLEGLNLKPKSSPVSVQTTESPSRRGTSQTPTPQPPTPKQQPPRPGDDYIVPRIDITEEVNRRLQVSRLQRLMVSPSTAQKRKYDSLVAPSSEGGTGEGEDGEEQLEFDARERSPKKLRAMADFDGTVPGSFEERFQKRKDESLKRKDGEIQKMPEQNSHKRRRI
ncbi:hypothetical protein K504DRAFT_466389 [Pleomassaria siparia CBS 279.74]|uniref:Uncharacterized protein n=1 Tax=Pleomassaria siparia CBS 279.74 TaxID=1314801 RepID=A0A6G1KAZ7_9PLEO|nr:hypothetical protein K504DRAFT_466389 [Pleomassaria siparia CBS 279.74]